MGFRDRGAHPTGLEVGDGADSAGRRLWPRSWGCHWGCGGEAKKLRREKENSGLAPGESGTQIGRGRREKEREKTWTRAKSGQSLGSSWPNRGKRVNECFRRFAQSEVFLETAGFVSRDLRDPRWKRNWSWLAEEDVRQ